MGLPRIVYDPGSGSRNLNFPEDLDSLEPQGRGGRIRKGLLNTTQRGVLVYNFQSFHWVIEPTLSRMDRSTATGEAFEIEARSFWSHAGKGGGFSFLLDRDEAVNTTLSVGEAAGATTIDVTSVAGIGVGKRYWLLSLQKQVLEIVKPTSVGASSFDIAAPGLTYGYEVGSLVLSEYHYPSLAALQDENPLTLDRGAGTMTFRLLCESYFDLLVV